MQYVSFFTKKKSFKLREQNILTKYKHELFILYTDIKYFAFNSYFFNNVKSFYKEITKMLKEFH